MALFSSLIPGIREIRAPLFAGYLWLLCAWLVFDPSLSAHGGNPTLERVAEAAEAVKPVGAAIAGSVAAYLVGSLIQGVIGSVSTALTSLQVIRRVEPIRDWEEQEPGSLQPLSVIADIADPSRGLRLARVITRNSQAVRAVAELADSELTDSYRRLRATVAQCERLAGRVMLVELNGSADPPFVRLRIGKGGESEEVEEFAIPQFSPVSELTSETALLQTRLTELAEGTGAEVERLQAESQFRLTLAAPLVVLILILPSP